MKNTFYSIITILFFSLSLSAQQTGGHAAEECVECLEKKISVTPANEIKELTDVAEVLDKEKFDTFVLQICAHSDSLRTSTPKEAGVKIENLFLEYLGINREASNYKKKIADFYNAHHDKLICKNTNADFKRPEHFLKRVINASMYKFILEDFLLYDEEELPINVNTVEIHNGNKETVVDYIDKILASPDLYTQFTEENIKEISLLQELLIEDFGAVRAVN